MKLSLRVEAIQLLLIAAMFGVAAWAWSNVPERMPIHWNLQGEPDGYGGRFAGLLLLPLISLGVYVLLLVLPRLDPGRINYRSFTTAYNVIRVAIVTFLGVVYAVTVLVALGYHVDVTVAISLAVGALFVVLGNFMGKIRPNWFVGVRTPWTLSSKLSWDKTHRLAGWLFMLMGPLLALSGVLRTPWVFGLTMVVCATCAVWLVVYSYVVYRRDPNRIAPSGTSASCE